MGIRKPSSDSHFLCDHLLDATILPYARHGANTQYTILIQAMALCHSNKERNAISGVFV